MSGEDKVRAYSVLCVNIYLSFWSAVPQSIDLVNCVKVMLKL